MVSEVVSEYAVLEDYDILEGIVQFFELNKIQYFIMGTSFKNGKVVTIHSALLLPEDALFLSIKYPNLHIKKISTFSE